jgi:hypothetical protein
MLRTDSYAIYPETDRFHRIRRIARQPFVACMARPLSLRLSGPLTNGTPHSKKNRAGDRCDRAAITIADMPRLTCGKFAKICTFARERGASERDAAAGVTNARGRGALAVTLKER